MLFTCLAMFRLLGKGAVAIYTGILSNLMTYLQDIIKTQRLYVRYVDRRDMSAYGIGYSVVIFLVKYMNRSHALNDVDFRGSYFNQASITNAHYAYPSSMKNADFRCSSWINVFHSAKSVYVSSLDGSDFTNAYVSSPEKIRVMLKTQVTFAGQPTAFPPFKKNSCYFNYQPPAKLRPARQQMGCILL